MIINRKTKNEFKSKKSQLVANPHELVHFDRGRAKQCFY